MGAKERQTAVPFSIKVAKRRAQEICAKVVVLQHRAWAAASAPAVISLTNLASEQKIEAK
jgi:hypothetical protein